jgi:hypothetical protein
VKKTSEKALDRVRAICLGLPGAEEKISHGAPVFHVRGKLFVMFADNHHGVGWLAVWCKAPAGAQTELVDSDPGLFFVPPYVGPSGWVGLRLDRKASAWDALASLAEDGWRMVAPRKIVEAAEAVAGGRPEGTDPPRRRRR